MKNRILSLILAVALVLSLTFAVSAASYPFKDVPDGQWYSEHIQYVYDNGLMAGTGATAFNPDGTMTRAMTVTVLYRLAGSPEPSSSNPFKDIPADMWYTDPVIWAVEHGITSGTSPSTFDPDTKVTREQLVTFLYRYAAFIDETLVAEGDANLSQYKDASLISKYAAVPFGWAVRHGIISGTSGTELSPAGSATRAQCATILSRFDKWMNSVSAEPHKHNYTAQETVAPTCTEAGYTIYKCSCGDSYTGNEVEATGHDFISRTDGSLITYTCQTCGYAYSEEVEGDPDDDLERAIASYVAQYINQYRAEQDSRTCEILPGMTLVAEYRALQLTTNYAHDTKDMREAASYYEYGEYVDMTKFGESAEESYWTCYGREAIGYVDIPSSNAEVIAQKLATACRNSESHWAYIGDDIYSYIAVGVEKANGRWYCCIMVNEYNYG